MMRTRCLTVALTAALILSAAPASAFPSPFSGVSASIIVEEPDSADWRGYFPLEVGNIWQYHDIHEDISFGVLEEWAEQWTVTSKIVIDEQEYFVISVGCELIQLHEALGVDPCRRAGSGRLVRYDAAGANVVERHRGARTVRPFFFQHGFRLDAPFGTDSESDDGHYEYEGGPEKAFVVGDRNYSGRVKTVQVYSAIPGHLTFAHGVGLIETYFSEGSGGGRTLRYSRTGTGEFGSPMDAFTTPEPLRVVYTEPFNRGTMTSQADDVRFVFNRPIEPSTFAYFSSDNVQAGEITFSDDSTSVVLSVTHGDEPGDITWVVYWAEATDGTRLSPAHVLRYTSDDKWGDATISGEVWLLVATKQEYTFSNIVFALLDRWVEFDVADHAGGLEGVVAAAPVVHLDGQSTFELNGIRPGFYVPVAVVDHNEDGVIDGLKTGWMLNDRFERIDTLDVRAGEHVVLTKEIGMGSRVETAPPHAPLTLSAPYPNPASGSIDIRFSLDTPQRVQVDIVDILGRHVATIADEALLSAHEHRFSWYTGTAPSGVYYIRVSGPRGSISRALVIVR